MALRYGDAVVSKPQAKLAGWFERRTSPFWQVKRWLELNGSILSYSHRQDAEVVWQCDLRECTVSAGSKACELILHRPGHDDFSIYALSLDELKLWFGEIKKVSDGVYDFYHFSAKVGRGSSGVVYLGRDKRTEQPVAILAQEKTKLPLDRVVLLSKRDRNVIRATQDHNNIVAVLDIFESTKQFYTIFELVSGGTIHEALLREKISEDIARQITRDILRALCHLHSHGIVHGAVAAKNILCTRRRFPCDVKLMTYGKAMAMRDEALLTKTVVDFSSSAPEVVCFHNRTAASDVFSLGVLLFRLLSGSEPFTATHESTYLSRVSRGAQLDDQQWQNVSLSAKQLVLDMLADQPASRPTAEQCLDCAWFRQSISDVDAGDGDGLPRCPSDPKTVIVDFDMARRRSSRSRNEKVGQGAGSAGSGSYAHLE